MRIAKLSVLGLSLAMLPAAGSLCGQINPNTALNAAKSGAQTANSANQSAGQSTSTSQPKPQSQPKPPAQQNQAQPKPASQPAQAGKQSQTPANANSGAATGTAAKPAPLTGKATPVTAKPSSTSSTAAKPASSQASTKAQPANGAPKTVPVVAKPSSTAPAIAPNLPIPKVVVELPKPAQPMIHAVANRRDPFSTLIGRDTRGLGKDPVLPPGKAGLQVETLIIQGLVRGPNGMIAVVANPQQRVYFLHEGDSLFDGKVDRITIEGVTFHEMGKDAFGKPLERDVTKRINAISSGEQP